MKLRNFLKMVAMLPVVNFAPIANNNSFNLHEWLRLNYRVARAREARKTKPSQAT